MPAERDAESTSEAAPGTFPVRCPQVLLEHLAQRVAREFGAQLHPVEAGADLPTVLAGESCAAPAPPEAQGESVAVLAGTAGLLTVSESEQGVPVTLHRTAPR